MDKRMKLLGFVGDWADNEMALSSYLPVISYQGEWYVALHRKWTFDKGIRKLSRYERGYVHRVRSLSVHEGEVVWLAGPRLVTACEHNPLLADLRTLFSGWLRYRKGFLFETGTEYDFLWLARSLYSQSKLDLMNGIFGFEKPIAKESDLHECFDVFSSTGVFDDNASHWAICGLVYIQFHDFDKYERARIIAVETGAFPDNDSYDDAVRKLAEAYRRKPLRETDSYTVLKTVIEDDGFQVSKIPDVDLVQIPMRSPVVKMLDASGSHQMRFMLTKGLPVEKGTIVSIEDMPEDDGIPSISLDQETKVNP